MKELIEAETWAVRHRALFKWNNCGMRHGYTNTTRRMPGAVLKTYAGPDSSLRQHNEVHALRAVAGRYPVPEILDVGPDSLLLGFVPGEHGQDLVDAGHADEVLRACGLALRTLHNIDVTTVFPQSTNRQHVVTHGDFGPNNVLLDPGTFEVTAVLDWEFSAPGDAIVDAAWCEWIVRMHHPAAVTALSAFHDAYGSASPWPTRQAAMISRCLWLRDFSLRLDPEGGGAALWEDRALTTARWTEL
jgi:aminoglycoside phosphotransferase (APT) family kinase protein